MMTAREQSSIRPARIAAPALWLDAADLAASHADGQAVMLWPDRSGNGYDAEYEKRVPEAGRQTGVHAPPTFAAGKGADFPSVSFDAAGRQTLVFNLAGRALGQGVAGFTVAFLLRPALHGYDSATGAVPSWPDGRVLFITHLSNLDIRFSVQLLEETGEVRVCSRPRPGLPRDTVSSFAGGERLALQDGKWQRLILAVDYAARAATLAIDGRTMTAPLPAGPAERFEDLPSAITGIGSNTLGAWSTFRLAEMACYERALTAAEMSRLDASLREKHAGAK